MSTRFLSQNDQQLPSDPPYTNGYLRDLFDQIRQHAAMITSIERTILNANKSSKPKPRAEAFMHAPPTRNTVERATQSNMKLPSSPQYAPFPFVDPRLLESNPASDTLERAPSKVSSSTSNALKRNLSIGSADDGARRSMARRKKNAPPMDINKKCSSCDKVFKRPCDLT